MASSTLFRNGVWVWAGTYQLRIVIKVIVTSHEMKAEAEKDIVADLASLRRMGFLQFVTMS